MTRDYLFLSASLFLWGIGEGMFFYFQPIYLAQLGASPMTIGFVLGLGGLVMTLAHIPAGWLADRWGRRPLLWTAWVMGLISAWLMALAKGLRVFAIGAIMYNFTAFVIAPLNSYLTEARGKLSIGRAITLSSSAFASGSVLGPFSAGLLAETFSLRAIYFAAAGLFVLSTLLVFFLRPQPREVHDGQESFRDLLDNTRYLNFLRLSFLAFFALYLPQSLTPNFLQNQRGLSLAQIGQLGSLGSLGNAVFNLVMGQLSPRLGFLLSQGGVLLFTLLIWKGSSLPWYGAAYLMLGGYRAARALASAQARSLVKAHQMGLAYGIVETLNSLPLFLAPPVAGRLYELRPDLIYPLSLAMIALALLLSLLLLPVPRSDSIHLSQD
ncbi:MAG: MFS transporter [Anaerolineales bacterium]|nr:MFS transporter [Anaerolineales bacterium]MDW8226405.1 MFS transporter [Anaerolineales bacterium]